MVGNTDQVDYPAAIDLMKRVTEAGFKIIKTENLYHFDGQLGYSLAQGQ